MEYVLIIGLISAVFVGMNIYIKRGIQGRVKEMTDYFISADQLVVTDPTTSSTDRTQEAKVDDEIFISGGTKRVTAATENIESKTEVEDRVPIVTNPEVDNPGGN